MNQIGTYILGSVVCILFLLFGCMVMGLSPEKIVHGFWVFVIAGIALFTLLMRMK